MRGLIKRDDPKLQASVHTPGAAGQLPDGACLRSFAVAGGAAAAHAHVRNEPIPRRLLSCGASSDAEAFIRWRHAALSPSSAAATRASSAAPACILLMLPQASARAACAWLALEHPNVKG